MDSSVTFKSVFKDEFIEFIKYKRLAGHKCNKQYCYKLTSLDCFFEEENLTEKKITLDIIEKWLSKNPNNSPLTKSLKYNAITSFSKFLISRGYKEIFVIFKNPYPSQCTFIPYIYSKEEINQIFNALSANKSNNNGLIIYTCISILYCCGLRSGELLTLKLKDFNYKDNSLTVENGKNNVTRIIPLTQELSNLLKEYVDYNIYTSNNDFIFNNKRSRDRTHRIIMAGFKEAIRQIENQNVSKNKLPRLHDLRHTFAVHTLNNMLEQGFKLYQCLPILSIYLGHKSVRETEYYLRLVEVNFRDVTNKALEYTNDIYKRKDRIYNGE